MSTSGSINRDYRSSSSLVVVFSSLSLILMTYAALVYPIIAYDAWWYHLPFASYIFNIGGGESAFRLDYITTYRWLGFPKAWEFLQGAAWYITGSLYGVIVPQLAICLIYIFSIARFYQIPFAWMILGFFSSPMLVVHFQSTYLDLPAAICVCVSFFLFVALLRASHFSWRYAAFGVISASIAGNIKYQSLLIVWIITGLVGVFCCIRSDLTREKRLLIMGTLILGNIFASATTIRNMAVYGNPFYPIEVHVGEHVMFAGPESPETDAKYPTYLLEGREIKLLEPLNFILSVTEFDWIMRGVAPWYDLGSSSGDAPRRGPPSRTGGWGVVFVFLNGCIFLAQIIFLRRENDQEQRYLVIGGTVLMLVTALLPRAHELRYWLYIPLMVLTINLRALRKVPYPDIVSGGLIMMMIYGTAEAMLSPNSGLIKRQTVSMETMKNNIPLAIKKTILETSQYCESENYTVFKYSAAVTGLKSVVSFGKCGQ